MDFGKSFFELIRDKHFLRSLSDYIPLKRPNRLHFQRELLSSEDVFVTDDQADNFQPAESSELLWFAPTPVSLADIPWLIHHKSNVNVKQRTQSHPNCLCHRMRRRQSFIRDGPDSTDSASSVTSPCKKRRLMSVWECESRDDIVANTVLNSTTSESGYCTARDEQSSPSESGYTTPFSGYSTSTVSPREDATTVIVTDPDAMKKLSDMEQELLRLRQQIAVLVVTQEQMAKSQWVPGGSLQLSSISDELDSNGPPIAPPPAAAPPPPPPPPPVLFTPMKSITDIISETKVKKGGVIGPSGKLLPVNKAGGVPDMSEVLKSIGTVKLRSVKRSPGGTPLRMQPLASDPADPASLIAQALKKKFARFHRVVESPEKEESSPGHHDKSWDMPITPPGPHLLHRRRQTTKRH